MIKYKSVVDVKLTYISILDSKIKLIGSLAMWLTQDPKMIHASNHKTLLKALFSSKRHNLNYDAHE